MKRYRSIILALTLGLLGSTVQAQNSLSEQPGYVDFGNLSGISEQSPKVEISLGSALLGFLSAASQEEDAELAETLGKLRSIRVSVFELEPGDYADARSKAEDIGRQLEAKDWEPAVVVKSEDATVRMYMKMVGDRVAGMAVMALEPGSDAVFMNIVGEIDPAQLGRVAAKFGVPLDEFDATNAHQ